MIRPDTQDFNMGFDSIITVCSVSSKLQSDEPSNHTIEKD